MLFFEKIFAYIRKMLYLCTRFTKSTLLNGVMVALQILVLSVWVRVLVEQQRKKSPVGDFFLLIPTLLGFSECHNESCMHIDAGLCVVPRASAAVHEPACFRAAVAGELGIEDVIQLAQQFDLRHPLFLW